MNDIQLELQDAPNTTLEVQEQADIEFNLSEAPSIVVNDYSQLTNKPQINSVELNGNKTGDDLGLVSKETGKGLSSNDFTNTLKSKLEGIEEGATKVENTSDITNDSGFITKSVNNLDNYYTETEVDGLIADIEEEIPTKTSELINDSGYLTQHQDITGKADTTYVNTELVKKQNTITSENKLSYNLLQDTPTIPSKTSDLTNDSGFLTEHQSLSNYYTKTQTDNAISNHHDNTKQDTINDLSTIRSGANLGATSLQPNDNVSELNNDVGYLTQHQSLSAYRTSANQDTIDNTKADKSTTYTKTEVDSAISNHHDSTKQDAITSSNKLAYSLISGAPTIPSKTSNLTNDSGFITKNVSDLTYYRTLTNQDVIDNAIKDDIDDIEALIPSQATSSNQLSDKDFVNSSIATNTAYFKGTFNIVDDLGLSRSATHVQVASALATKIASVTNNDYSFVAIPNATITTQIDQYDRYKYTSGSGWAFEFTLNNSTFTSNQWASINSGLSSTYKTKLDGIETGAQVNDLEGVQVNGTDLTITNKKVNVPIAEANKLGVVQGGAYGFTINEWGYPIGITMTKAVYDIANALSFICKGTLDNVLVSKQDVISNTNKLAYSLLSGTPTIPSKTSDLTNDSGFLTSHQDITGKENISNKVTSISSSSTDTQYPSAKCVYDIVGNIETLLGALL